MSIKLSKDAYSSAKKEFEVPNGQGKLKLYAYEIGYLRVQMIQASSITDKSIAPLALIIAESIKDADGNQFTYDEVLNLKKEVSGPILDAVIEVNGLGNSEKN